MYESVREAFPSFSTRFEGRVPWMYLDIKGLVTIGVGNLIDPESAALGLPFVHRGDGAQASSDEIAAEWEMLKGKQELAQKGHKACESLTELRLTDDAIDDLVRSRLDANEQFLKGAFPEWDAWPADAQLGVLSMAWALGAGFTAKWPNFTGSCLARDWAGAEANSHISETGNPGVKPRNEADALLFTNAGVVDSDGRDASQVYYPQDLSSAPPAEEQAATESTSEEGEAVAEESSGDDTTSEASFEFDAATEGEAAGDEGDEAVATEWVSGEGEAVAEESSGDTTSEGSSEDDAAIEEELAGDEGDVPVGAESESTNT